MPPKPAKLSLNERKQIKLAREMVEDEKLQEALLAVIQTAKGHHRKSLTKIQAKTKKKQLQDIKSMARIEEDLLWEREVLVPLVRHMQQLATNWQGSQLCSEALAHLQELKRFGDVIVKHYDQDRNPRVSAKKIDTLETTAHQQFSSVISAAPFFPLQSKRQEVAQATWDKLLSSMQKATAGQLVDEGVHSISGYLDWYFDTAKIAEAMLEGSTQKVEQALGADSIGPQEFGFVTKFVEECMYEDDYKEDKQARKAHQQAQALGKITPAAPSTTTRRF